MALAFISINMRFFFKEGINQAHRENHGCALKTRYRYTVNALYQSADIQTTRNAKVRCSKCRETADRKRRKSNPGNGLCRIPGRNHSLFPDS